jgi:hypothetical protein
VFEDLELVFEKILALSLRKGRAGGNLKHQKEH